MKALRPLIVGNWKMNPVSLSSAVRLFKEVKKSISRTDNVMVAVAPPALYIAPLSDVRGSSKKIALGAQNVYWKKSGAHTGEISIPMLKDLGASYVIVGHSERRATGISDEAVNMSTKAIVKSGLTAIVCVGERKRDTHGNYLSFVERQVREALSGISKTKLGSIVMAYEPVWAIGTGKTATPEDVYEMKLFIQKVISRMHGRNYVHKVRILYGGSVHAENTEELLTDGKVDGFLVGGASLKPDEFAEIIKIAKQHGC